MEKIKGFVDHIIYRNPDNGYTVLVLDTDGEEETCVGMLRAIEPGMTIEADGDFIAHNVYGRQFKIQNYVEIEPEDAAGMERYLGSGAVNGIGPALARRIVKRFGADTFRILEEEPERLAEIKGISERKARDIAEQVEDKKDMRDAMIFLQKYGISNTLAVKIFETYGVGLYGILKENPYRLAEDIEGVGFKIADEIAEKIGIHMDSDYRIRSGILYALLQAGGEGHIYLPKEILLHRAAVLLGISDKDVEPQLGNLAMDKKLVLKQDAVYAPTYYYAELNCARMLHDLNVALLQDDESLPAEQAMLQNRLKTLENSLEITLDELQKQAVLKSIESGIFILSGGPGTGKTTTINAMIHYFESEGLDMFLAAPTGRAAKRMTEATGYEARTIHRMLELNGAISDDKKGFHFERNEENPLEVDVIIIDEMSMVDIFLFQSLLRAVPVGTRLILVGDVDQLPSVGPGQVLRDLIESHAFPTVVLQKIFRQAGESNIVLNAHRINRGEDIALDNKSKDFFFLERNDTNVIYKHMVQLIRDKMPKYVGASSYDIQVLTPMRKGALGAEVLNRILQEYLNPPSEKKEEHPYGDGCFREGDKVMQIRNDYQLEWEILSRYGIPIDKGTGIFNGDSGIIKEIDNRNQFLIVEFDENRKVHYGFSQLDEIELAYAITIHKAQGSEYPAVVMPILNGSRMLFNRNLLYTGVTRAKSCVTILGSREMLKTMIANVNENSRYTSLEDRIREMNQTDLG
ncbi:MAG: ATP-dependent RecD-like DNA helicase [Lachnospiraceae bacterium]|nr:ATP-dependent RecD-like DNA helicase [Lachnospiraceae bacterium]